MKLERNRSFQKASHLMENTRQHLFITGKAGTGKSTLLDYFCKHTKKKPILLAPTGIAALNIQGQTIHKFFNFHSDITPEKIRTKEIKPRQPKIYKKLNMIIIDEVSMLRADLLDCIDTFLRLYGPQSTEAFGGVQLVFVGDLYQLPPVVSRHEISIFNQLYSSPYFFSAQVLETMNLTIIELEKIYRQKQQHFIQLLNKIRNNSVNYQDLQTLNQRLLSSQKGGTSSTTSKALTLCLVTTNAKADEINEENLRALDTKEYLHKATISGDFSKEYYPTAKNLIFKKEAQIMLLNNDSEGRWANGSMGIIKGNKKSGKGDQCVQIKLQHSDRVVLVPPYTWEIHHYYVRDNILNSILMGSFTQYPFRLAWAVTIHKSQGKTFHKVIIDLGYGAFASGQTYVALSRCTSLEGICLKTPIRKRDIQTDPKIHQFLSLQNQNKMSSSH